MAKRSAVWLWLLLALFVLRVLGQIIVAIWAPPILPPMYEWYSGVIPYPFLLTSQLLIILLLTTVAVQFSRGEGWFVAPKPKLGRLLLWFGSIYLAAMIIRYVARMIDYPEERWAGGAIPIFFHWVLATYVLLVAFHHLRSYDMERAVEGPPATGLSRRRFMRWAGAMAIASTGGFAVFRVIQGWLRKTLDPLLVNDMHSQLNEARVAELIQPTSLEELYGAVKALNRAERPIAICGSRHAMGGQQFLKGGALIDTRQMKTVIELDRARGFVDVEAGIEWPDLVDHLLSAQQGEPAPWTIGVKQTGADKLTIGGALSANAHGRSLTKPPFVSDVESFLLVDADGELVRCSRSENQELFSSAIGGYGLFGVVHSVVLRLTRRQKLRRMVEVIDISDLHRSFKSRIADGFTLGDFQFATDEKSEEFLRRGVFSCYEPVDMATPIPEGQDSVSDRAWEELVYLAHTEKSRAFQLYADYYKKTSGQVYWSDTSQIGGYPFDYHKNIDKRMGIDTPATEMITEIYVPREKLVGFMAECASALPKVGGDVIYGTIRLIEKDDETFLAWAKENYACVIFNLHVVHTPDKIRRAANAFRTLIDLWIERGGSYYLTYHRWARKEQVLACYPQFPQFMSRKRKYDPTERFQSDWYVHYRQMFG